MMKFEIKAADIRGPWRFDGVRWTSGESSIRPFAHRAIESALIVASDATIVVTREVPLRRSDEVARVVRSEAPSGTLLDEVLAWDLCVQAIVLPADASSVIIANGATATAPLFVTSEPDRVHGSWDVSDLYGVIPWGVDFALAAYSLANLGLPYSHRTVFPGVHQVTERARVSWRVGTDRMLVAYPAPSPQPAARRLKADADVFGSFERLFEAIIRRSVPSIDHPLATELSGGLDSAIATIMSAQAHGSERVRSYGLLLPGERRAAQEDRRREVASMLGIADSCVEPQVPFSLGLQAEDDPAIPWGEYYREAFSALAGAAARDGCSIVVRGIGGDEISELSQAEYRETNRPSARRDARLPSFLTEEARQACSTCRDSLDPAPPGFAAESAYLATAASSFIYLRRGIWPIYPYICREMLAFALSLPVEWRVDRRLQRGYLQRRGLSREVVRPSQPETFLPLRDAIFAPPVADRVRALFERPLLADLGLVDADALGRAFSSSDDQHDSTTRTHLLEAATMETTLRTWRSASSPQGP